MHQDALHAGSFMVVPCGQYKQTADSPTLFTAYVYARGHWAQPFLRLPATNKVNPAHAFLDVSSCSQSKPLQLQLMYANVVALIIARTDILALNTDRISEGRLAM